MSKSRRKQYPASVKVAAIADYCSKTMSQKAVGNKYGVSHVTIINWMKEKEQILQECKDSAKLFPVFDLVTGNPRQIPDMEELALKVNQKTPEALKQELKALREENAYLTDKLAYMEALFSLEGIPVGKVGKKKDKNPSGLPSTIQGAQT